MSYQFGAELLNYGALLAFMGVNLSSAVLAWRAGKGKQWFAILLSLTGCAVCFFLWINLGPMARVLGTSWAVIGIILWLFRRKKMGNTHSSAQATA
jgi:putrescine importer